MGTLYDDEDPAVFNSIRQLAPEDNEPVSALDELFNTIERALPQMRRAKLPFVLKVEDPTILDCRDYDGLVEVFFDVHGVRVERGQGLVPLLPEYFLRAYIPDQAPKVAGQFTQSVEELLESDLASFETKR